MKIWYNKKCDDVMRVWIINKGKTNEKDISKKFLSYVYHQEKNKEINLDKIKYGKYGKPYYNDFFYNISHSKNYMCIITANSEVGIDIEEERKITPGLDKRILTPEEQLNNDLNLIEYWVIKEAYSKYKGIGLRMPFNKVTVLEIKQNLKVYNLCTKQYYCYAIGTEPLEKINFIDINDVVGDNK